MRQCCRTDEEENHREDCPMIADMNQRFKRDFSGETFRDSYINHSATAVRRRVLQASNGHSEALRLGNQLRGSLP